MFSHGTSPTLLERVLLEDRFPTADTPSHEWHIDIKMFVYTKSICPIPRNAFVLTAGGTFRRLAHLARMVNLTAIGPAATCTKNAGGSSIRPAHDTLTGGDQSRDFDDVPIRGRPDGK